MQRVAFALILTICVAAGAQQPLKTPFAWEYSAPLVSPEKRQGASLAEKDPTIVFDNGRWHLWVTTKNPPVTLMEYLSFESWDKADRAPRAPIHFHDKYACAPQVFYFTPQKKWYMIFQKAGYADRGLKMQIVYSTTTTIADLRSWSSPQPLFEKDPEGVRAWIDPWVICDNDYAYFFFTSNNGRMWRTRTPIGEFPRFSGKVELALAADIFEASHTYHLKGSSQYLTLIEAQGKDAIRYYKAYLADRLDGKWIPLADSQANPFAGLANVRPGPGVKAWTDNISHGELLRDSNDQTLTVDPSNLKFLFQGCLQSEKAGKSYSQFPWRLGILTPAQGTAPSDK